MVEKDKHILVGGCSFTAHETSENLSWAFHLEKTLGKGSIINSAQMGSGNQIICDRLCYQLSKKEIRENTAAVVVMWSSPFRKEFLFTHEDPDWRTIYNGMKKEQQTTFTNYILNPENEKTKHPMSNWLIIGGGYGIWDFGIPSLDRRLRSYYDNIFNKAECYVSMCRAMITLQSLCKVYKIPLVNMCWQNIFHDLHVSEMEIEEGKEDRNHNSVQATIGWLARRLWNNYENKREELPENMKTLLANRRIDKMYPDCKHWYDMIDWDTWFFYENEHIKMGGLQEYRYWVCGDEPEKLQYHPSAKIQKKWMSVVKEELTRRDIL